MNQENKSGDFKEKLLQYWAAFLAVCGKIWEYVKVNGRTLLQKLAAWLLKAKEWLTKATADLRVKGKAALEQFSVWLAGVAEKLRPIPGRIRDRFQALAAPRKDGNAAEIPAPDATVVLSPTEEPKALPEVIEAAPAEAEVPAAEQKAAAEPAKAANKITNPYLRKTVDILAAIGRGIKLTLKWLWKLRRIFMAIPVIWAAVKFAMENMERLPEQVGLDIQSTGEFARMISRQEAVFWPLGITMFCLLLMFCSKKPVLPWVISIFTLVLPWLIWILNYYA